MINDVNMIITIDTSKSLLMEACETGSVECVKMLMANNADLYYESQLYNFIERVYKWQA